MATPQYNVGVFQATSGFSTDDGRLTDGNTSIGNGWENTGSGAIGSTAQVTALYDLGSSPPSQAQADFAVAWEGSVNCILDTSNDLSAWTTRASFTTPDHGGTYGSATFRASFSPSVTARYWRLSIQDTTAGGAFSG